MTEHVQKSFCSLSPSPKPERNKTDKYFCNQMGLCILFTDAAADLLLVYPGCGLTVLDEFRPSRSKVEAYTHWHGVGRTHCKAKPGCAGAAMGNSPLQRQTRTVPPYKEQRNRPSGSGEVTALPQLPHPHPILKAHCMREVCSYNHQGLVLLSFFLLLILMCGPCCLWYHIRDPINDWIRYSQLVINQFIC